MLSKNDNIIVSGTAYGNDVGRAVVLDPDYKGFPAKKGLLVQFLDRPDHVGFVSYGNYMKVKSLDPTRKVTTTPKPETNKTQEDLQILLNEHAKEEEKIYKAQFTYSPPQRIRLSAEPTTMPRTYEQVLQEQIQNSISNGLPIRNVSIPIDEGYMQEYNPFRIDIDDTL